MTNLFTFATNALRESATANGISHDAVGWMFTGGGCDYPGLDLGHLAEACILVSNNDGDNIHIDDELGSLVMVGIIGDGFGNCDLVNYSDNMTLTSDSVIGDVPPTTEAVVHAISALITMAGSVAR